MANKPTYDLTTISVQGDDQYMFEVYEDESREQTFGFISDKKNAAVAVEAVSLYRAIKERINAIRVAHKKLKFQSEDDAGTNDGEHDAGGDLRDELNALYEIIGIKEI